jgi:CRISPR-associated exonuclease Cas4
MDDDWLTLSSLEHHTYCRWQARLLLDGVWVDNHLTVQGSAAHARVDRPGIDSRRGARVHHRVAVVSQSLRLHGIADAVEEQADGALMPVEHKWGRGAGDLRPLFVQVTAQALCLEEMLGVAISTVAIFVVSEQRREVAPTEKWRALTLEAIEAARADLMTPDLPPPEYAARRCRNCSVVEACQPRRKEF